MFFLKLKNNLFYNSGVIYPVPSNLTYFWNFGIYALVMLFLQILTGLFLAMHYIPAGDYAFLSVEHIMKDVNYGWLLRYIHANGASMFFIVVYVHILRGLYYGSYIFPREFLWVVGVLILLLMILTAFLGYVLPWGQMSFWAATVITNLVSVIPKIGPMIVVWLWGGYAVGDPTLNRFFSLHFLFSFLIVVLVLSHLSLLHSVGSNNPLGLSFLKDKYPIYPYYYIKDLFGICIFFVFVSFFLYFFPNTLGHPDNYIPANPLVTPIHIVPEWYFLPFYAVLRSIPNKLFGVLTLLAMVFSLALLPFYSKRLSISFGFKPVSRFCFWLFVLNLFVLGWAGAQPMEHPYIVLGRFCTFFYFFYLFFLHPIILKFEHSFWFDYWYLDRYECIKNHRLDYLEWDYPYSRFLD